MMKAEILSRHITSIKTPSHIHEVAQKKQSIFFYGAHIPSNFMVKNIMKKQLTQHHKLFSMGSFVTEKRIPSQICSLHCARSRQISPEFVISDLLISANLAQFQTLFYSIPIHKHLELYVQLSCCTEISSVV